MDNYMKNSKSMPLDGNHNKRINKLYELECEETAAWTNTAKTNHRTNVSIPKEEGIINAKEWADDGSRL